MLFDTDFVVFLKRKDTDFSYIWLYITNDELIVNFESIKKGFR